MCGRSHRRNEKEDVSFERGWNLEARTWDRLYEKRTYGTWELRKSRDKFTVEETLREGGNGET